jgi:hypothetical protein
MIALAFLALSTVSGFANVQPMVAVPTLSEWGLIALIVVIGIAGALVLRKRLASARPSK